MPHNARARSLSIAILKTSRSLNVLELFCFGQVALKTWPLFENHEFRNLHWNKVVQTAYLRELRFPNIYMVI